MNFVLTLIAHGLTEDHVNAVAAEVTGAVRIDWLAPNTACDLYFVTDPGAVEARGRRVLADAPVDLCFQAVPARRKKLLLADMDSTIITVECIDELGDLLGLRAEISAITEQAMTGEVDFTTALRARAGMLAGVARTAIDQLIEDRVTLSPGARALVRTMRAHGAHTALVSGGFTIFTAKVSEMAGFHLHRANTLAFNDGKLTGGLEPPILDATAKRKALGEFRRRFGLRPAETMAIGDGANDIEMLRDAGLGLAYRAKPAVINFADARIDHFDLTAALYMQGYRGEEFAD